MAPVTVHSNFGAQENKVCHCYHCFPIYLPWRDGTRCHGLSFLNVEFKASFIILLFHQEALQFLFTFCHKGGVTCTPMFITALFIIAMTWKQPRCPSADEWIRKLWYIYTIEYYSAIKKNTFESVLMKWMKLQPIIQSKVSQKEKHQYSILTHIYRI